MIFWEVFGAIFGLMIIGAWYMETYLDTTSLATPAQSARG